MDSRFCVLKSCFLRENQEYMKSKICKCCKCNFYDVYQEVTHAKNERGMSDLPIV